jgi:molecular chaperone HtpG
VDEQNFRVDLRGLVELLSHHLYSGPQVYVRELLQNAVDALTARQRLHPWSTGRVLLIPAEVAGDGQVHCLDTGIGLTIEEMERFLATIGSSSKRDELGFARADFLGQFGIGVLSCFLISDEITVVSRSAHGGGLVRWRGSADGSYQVEELDPEQTRMALAGLPAAAITGAVIASAVTGPVVTGETAVDARAGGEDGGAANRVGANWLVDQPGTWVSLRPRSRMQDWVGLAQVQTLAARYARMLPWQVDVALPADEVRRVSAPTRPWEAPGGVGAARAELEELVDAKALAVIPVTVAEAGLRGAVVILGQETAPTARQSHRVYVKGMLVGSDVQGVLPAWAFFARAVVDAEHLRLTASREELSEDDLLEQVRIALGEQVRRWMLRTAEVNPAVFERFLALHALGVKAIAAVDDDLLRAVLPWLRFETTAGSMTLPEVVARFGVIRYTATVDEFRQVAPVAAATGIGVVNAGYTYDAALIARLPLIDPVAEAQLLLPGDLNTHVEAPPEAVLLGMHDFVVAARTVLDGLDVEVQLRSFDPVSLPALVLDDREARYRRNARAVVESGENSAWAGILQAVDDGGTDRKILLINHRNPTVQQIATITEPDLLRLSVESLYCQALLAGQHPLQAVDTAALNRSFLGLIQRAIGNR